MRYKDSSFALTQGVDLANFKLDLIVGRLLNNLTSVFSPSFCHPCSATRYSIISINFTPCRGLLGCSSGGLFLFFSKDIGLSKGNYTKTIAINSAIQAGFSCPFISNVAFTLILAPLSIWSNCISSERTLIIDPDFTGLVKRTLSVP